MFELDTEPSTLFRDAYRGCRLDRDLARRELAICHDQMDNYGVPKTQKNKATGEVRNLDVFERLKILTFRFGLAERLLETGKAEKALKALRGEE